jgi:hypothetical protein
MMHRSEPLPNETQEDLASFDERSDGARRDGPPRTRGCNPIVSEARHVGGGGVGILVGVKIDAYDFGEDGKVPPTGVS